MGGRWRYNLIVSSKFTKLRIPRKARLWVDVTTLAFQTYSVLSVYQVYNTKKHKFVGGRWRYKLIVSLKFTKFTIQRNTSLRVDTGVTNL